MCLTVGLWLKILITRRVSTNMLECLFPNQTFLSESCSKQWDVFLVVLSFFDCFQWHSYSQRLNLPLWRMFERYGRQFWKRSFRMHQTMTAWLSFSYSLSRWLCWRGYYSMVILSFISLKYFIFYHGSIHNMNLKIFSSCLCICFCLRNSITQKE